MNSKILSVSAFVFLTTACQTTTNKIQVENLRVPASSDDFLRGVQDISNDLQNANIFNARTCRPYIDKITTNLFKEPIQAYLPKSHEEQIRFKEKAIESMKTIFQIRLQLRDKLAEFEKQGEASIDCVNSIREAQQFARFTEEYLLEWTMDQKLLRYSKARILEEQFPNTLVNSKFSSESAKLEIKTGDVFLIRGQSYVSAMIARIGDEEGNFSHLAIVGEDSKGQKYVVEALIPKGVTITPLEKWRELDDPRVVLFRYKDSEKSGLAQKAGRYIYDYVNQKKAKGEVIRYDFAMDYSDASSMFCSEVVGFAYKNASQGNVQLPRYKSSATKFEGTDYFKDLGIKKGLLFAPSDMEVDSRFDLVAEYRFIPLLNQVRMQDAVMQSVYEWMTTKKYDFHTSVTHSGKSFIAKVGRYMGFFTEKMPSYMPQSSLVTNLKYETVAGNLEQNLYKQAAIYKKKYGYAMSFREMMFANNEFRKADCQRSIASTTPSRRDQVESAPSSNNSAFHWFFYRQDRTCVK